MQDQIDFSVISRYPTVAIFTNFMDFNPGYSLSGIVYEQALMLLKKDHKVFLFVNEQFNPKFNTDSGLTSLIEQYPNHFKILQKTKFMHLTDYKSLTEYMESNHPEQAEEAAKIFLYEIQENKIDIVFTHDFVFTGWNIPYAEAVKKTSEALKDYPIKWFHWVHSVPSGRRDWWNLSLYGKNHYIVYPNSIDSIRVAESFQCRQNKVKVIPHLKDIRVWFDFSPETWEITERYPNLMQADIIQVYPASSDRMNAKQVHSLLAIFAHMKEARVPIFFFVANQWATGLQRREDVNKYISLGEKLGLVYEEDFVFSSTIDEKYQTGISKRMIRELQLLSNIFIFPTLEESFGLVGPEASYSGAHAFINRSLPMQYEVMGSQVPAYDFGSFTQKVDAMSDPAYLRSIAFSVLNFCFSNPILINKMYTRKRYNMDHLYYKYYSPNFF